MDKYLSKYEEYLKYELNYSSLTIKGYFTHIIEFNKYLNNKKISYKSLTKQNIINYLKYLDNKKLSNRTIANKLSALRSFFDFLLEENILNKNIFKLIRNPKLEKKIPNFLSYEEIRKIFDSIKCKTVLDYRNKLIIELLYASGIRVSELVNLKLKDFSFDERKILIMGKGKKERITFYGIPAAKALEDYLKVRASDNEYLLLNKYNNKISTRAIGQIVDKICLNAAVNNNVSPHTFRHTFATHLLNNGADIKSVQELLGHSSLDTTEVYTHITNDYLKSEYLRGMPRK